MFPSALLRYQKWDTQREGLKDKLKIYSMPPAMTIADVETRIAFWWGSSLSIKKHVFFLFCMTMCKKYCFFGDVWYVYKWNTHKQHLQLGFLIYSRWKNKFSLFAWFNNFHLQTLAGMWSERVFENKNWNRADELITIAKYSRSYNILKKPERQGENSEGGFFSLTEATFINICRHITSHRIIIECLSLFEHHI